MIRGEDSYTRELEIDKGQALWRVELSDGSVVVQDDGRPDVTPHSAWLRLADHLSKTGLRIKKFWLGFRNNIQPNILPANADGYFFCKSAIGQLNDPNTLHFYLLGALVEGKLTVQRWCVPELILLGNETRDPATAKECLIRC